MDSSDLDKIRVTLEIENAPLRQALDMLLQGTLLAYKVMKDGQIVIVKYDPDEKVNVKGYIRDAQSGVTLPYANISLLGKSCAAIGRARSIFFARCNSCPVSAASCIYRLAAYSEYRSESSRSMNAGTGDPNAVRQNFGSFEENRIRDFALRFDTEWQLNKSHRVEFGSWFSRTNVNVGFFANDTLQILRRDDDAVQTAFYLQTSGRFSSRWK
ncbi:MAG: secretin and TonB N-terminal domain-containing protein [bacterium]